MATKALQEAPKGDLQSRGVLMVTKYMFDKVRALIAQNKSDRDIAKALGLDRKTVAKYRKTNAPPHYRPRKGSTRQDPLSNFNARMAALLRVTSTLTAPEIYTILRDEGYAGSLRTVQRRLMEIRDAVPKERFFQQEYAPGEQSQFDFKEKVELPFASGPRIVHLHFGTLPHSGFFHIRGYPFKNYEAFIDGMHGFFERAGGLTEHARIDNLSPCVRQILKGSERVYTEAFQRAVDYYGFKVLPCAPGKGSEKGDVEREIRTQILRVKNLISRTGKVFRDFEDLNQWLLDFCMKFQTTKSKELWAKEQAALLPLPQRNDQILCRVEILPVNSYGTVRVAKSTYSVPDTLIHQNVRVVVGAYDVKIHRASGREDLIATHPRLSDNQNSLLLEHVLPSLVRKPHAMVRWRHRDLLFPEPMFRKYYAYLKERLGYGAEGEFLKTINLVHYVALGEIAAALELVMESEADAPFFTVKSLLLSPGHFPDNGLPEQHRLCPVLSIYDSLIPSFTEVSNA